MVDEGIGVPTHPERQRRSEREREERGGGNRSTELAWQFDRFPFLRARIDRIDVKLRVGKVVLCRRCRRCRGEARVFTRTLLFLLHRVGEFERGYENGGNDAIGDALGMRPVR